MKHKIVHMSLLPAMLTGLFSLRHSLAQTTSTQPYPPDRIEGGSMEGIQDQPATSDCYQLPPTAFYVPLAGSQANAIVQTAAGLSHTCVLTLAGGVKCWGDNWEGMLGDGSVICTLTPSLVKSLVAASLQISYTTGSPGSYFTLRSYNFDGWSNIPVWVNNIPLNSSLQTDLNGQLIFRLFPYIAEVGGYLVSVEAGQSFNVSFHMDISASLHDLEDSGLIYQIPGAIALTWSFYVPLGEK